MHILVVGVNHKTAPVELREKLSLDQGKLANALGAVRKKCHISEACIVSTCNRTEIYVVANAHDVGDQLVDFMADFGNLSIQELKSCVYRKAGYLAIKHLYEVACGLDSIALGETQILGQIKNAYCLADEFGSTGTILNSLFQKAIAVGKRARTETAISCGAYSIGSAAVELAKNVFGNIAGKTALILGAGKMSNAAANHLRSNGVEKIYVAGRTLARAEELASSLNGIPIEFDNFEEVLKQVDFLISCTSAPHPIITKSLMEKVMAQRVNSPIFLIDIAVPRDIEPDVADIDGVYLYNIDDLQFLIDQCMNQRKSEIDRVREIIESEIDEFMEYLRSLEAVPIIKQLRKKFESIYENEWKRCSSKLDYLPEKDREIIRKTIKSVVNKLSHDPILRIKEYASNGGKEKLEIVRDLYGLPSDNTSEKQ